MPKSAKRKLLSTACLIAALGFSSVSVAAGLKYDELTTGPVPIPPSERGLQSVHADDYFKVSKQGLVLEGANFDTNGDLIFSDVTGGRVMRLTPDKKLSEVVAIDGLSPGGMAFRQDGKLFIAAINFEKNIGAIYSVNADGSDLKMIVSPDQGYLPDDVAFNVQGGLYFTDFNGESTEATGGVYYISPDMKKITPVMKNLSKANGVALSPDGKALWVTEFGRNLLHRIKLADPVTIASIGSAIPYHFTGPAPDSVRVDSDGNVYVSIYEQGRIIVFNPNGIPIGQVLLPKRETGHNLLSTSMAIKPGTRDLYSVTSDGGLGEGANIFHAKVFANGLPLLHQK